MTLPLVNQLRFARSEFVRCLEGLSDEDARQRLLPMNCISWMIGHLAAQEQSYWLYLGQGDLLYPDLYELVGSPSTPLLAEMWQIWQHVTQAADTYLDALTADILAAHLTQDDNRSREAVGTMLLRNTYHYWFHTGEAHAVRQQLSHSDLPQFVGNMSSVVYQS